MDMIHCSSKVKVMLKEHPHIRGGSKQLKKKIHSTLQEGTRGSSPQRFRASYEGRKKLKKWKMLLKKPKTL